MRRKDRRKASRNDAIVRHRKEGKNGKDMDEKGTTEGWEEERKDGEGWEPNRRGRMRGRKKVRKWG
jgi:hypothetical protein